MTTIKLPVISCAEIVTSYREDGKKSYIAVVSVLDLPEELDEWRKINPRDPRLSSGVSKKVIDSLSTESRDFFFRNRGLTIMASDITPGEGKVYLELEDQKIHGLLDGGHTFKIIQKIREELIGEELEELRGAMVRVELMSGFTEKEEVVEIVQSRNTSTQVKDQSIDDLLGSFDLIKEILKNEVFEHRIAYKEHELSDEGRKKDIDIRTILAYMITMDIESYDNSSHPILAYNSKSAVLSTVREDKERLEKYMYLLPDILKLRDAIYYDLPLQHNSVGGRFGALAGVKELTRSRSNNLIQLPFSLKNSMYRFGDSYIFPILASFRVFLEVSDDEVSWTVPPLEVWEMYKPELTKIITDTAKDLQDAQKLGKKKDAWDACYQLMHSQLGEIRDAQDVIQESHAYPDEFRDKFQFHMVGIPINSELEFKLDSSITCTVTDSNKVWFENELTSLSAAALKVMRGRGKKWETIQGPAYWMYNGETLDERRKKKESLGEITPEVENYQTLKEFINQSGRVALKLYAWNKFYQDLYLEAEKRELDVHSIPIPLNSWMDDGADSPAWERKKKFLDLLDWIQRFGLISYAGKYLRSLPEDAWSDR